VGDEGALLHETVIRARPGFLCGLFVDEMYTVRCFMQFASGFASHKLSIIVASRGVLII
jgi:hypothetical protein